MIESHKVKHSKGCAAAINPPTVTGRRRNIPAIERVAPKLTSGAEIIGRNARNGSGPPSFIQAKQLRMSPHVSAVVSDIDRNVAHDANAVTTAEISYLFPLPKKFELGKPVKLQLRRQSCSAIPSERRDPVDIIHASQWTQADVIVDFFACHEERIVLQPCRVLLAKGIEGTTVGLCCCLQKKCEQLCEGVPV